jgi:ATP-dependent RNA helicase DeaD
VVDVLQTRPFGQQSPAIGDHALGDDESASNAGFEDFSLSSTMLAALQQANYTAPTPVQAGVIPRALQGDDVIAQARTGTGKTASFVIPILEQLRSGRPHHAPQALALVPTRELAVQVRDEVVKLAHGRRTRCVAVYGGKPIRGQIDKLQRGAQLVVGTPGRVLDHIARGTLDLRQLWCVVLDEADRMLDIGFRPDIEKILRRCPRERQTLLLSATVPPPIQRLARRYMREPVELNFSATDIAVETIDQYYFTVENEHKFGLLLALLKREKPKQALIFCRTKRGVDRLVKRLQKRLSGVDCIHGDMQQSARDRVMARFRKGSLRNLVATDVVGRGIDVTGISHIINFDIPQFCDDYVHRVGRTGRMGREGVAFTFVASEEGPELTRIEQRINRQLQRDEIADFASRPTASGGEQPGSPEGESREEPPPPPSDVLKRPPRRYRRAL